MIGPHKSKIEELMKQDGTLDVRRLFQVQITPFFTAASTFPLFYPFPSMGKMAYAEDSKTEQESEFIQHKVNGTDEKNLVDAGLEQRFSARYMAGKNVINQPVLSRSICQESRTYN